MKVNVRMFARAKELAGQAALTVELGASATVGDLRRVLSTSYPTMAILVAKSAIAVNHELVGDDTPLEPGQEIALLPPVSGGAG